MTNSNYPRCWIFDANRRVYRRDASGKQTGSPIWREHWAEVTITGETSRSWITSCDAKISKKGGPGIAFSTEEIDRLAIVEERYQIADAVRMCGDPDILKQVADLVGYTEKRGHEDR